MRELNIAGMILAKRREMGITQEELAAHIGVSKASVSKWEKAQCYPDLTILPQLAAFFDISIDELMGYQPQLSKEEIRDLYRELAEAFVKEPFPSARERCTKLAHRYYTCYPLLLQLGSLLVNHSMPAVAHEETKAVLEEAMDLFIRVKKNCGDAAMAKQAQSMEALCLLQLGRPEEAIELAGDAGLLQTSLESLLVTAHQMLGEQRQAKKIAQSSLYQDLIRLMNDLSLYLGLCGEDPDTADCIIARTDQLIGAFELETLHPGAVLPYDLFAARLYAACGKEEQALEYLERYTALATGEIWTLGLHGDGFFDLLDEWLEETLPLGAALPRDERMVKKSMTEEVADQPVFDALKKDPRFLDILRRLRQNERDEGKRDE